METLEWLKCLEKTLEEPHLPKSKTTWAGADVIVLREKPSDTLNQGFYPDQRYVVTVFSHELSWLIEELRDAFYSSKYLDGCTKVEFFGRLANAANRCIDRTNNLTEHKLCAAVLHEAFAIFDEMEEGTFQYLEVALGNYIADDYVDEALRSGFIGIEETLTFLRERGVEIGDA